MHKAFMRRPGCHMNILCTLRMSHEHIMYPVSIGYLTSALYHYQHAQLKTEKNMDSNTVQTVSTDRTFMLKKKFLKMYQVKNRIKYNKIQKYLKYRDTLPKTDQNMVFFWLVFARIKTESQILRENTGWKNPYSGLFYTVTIIKILTRQTTFKQY